MSQFLPIFSPYRSAQASQNLDAPRYASTFLPSLFQPPLIDMIILKVLLLLEELGEADDGAVDQQPTDDRHDHGWNLDKSAVCEEYREGNAHNNQEPCGEPSKVNPCARVALDEVVRVRASPGYPIRHGR